jgi:hypothetical protein
MNVRFGEVAMQLIALVDFVAASAKAATSIRRLWARCRPLLNLGGRLECARKRPMQSEILEFPIRTAGFIGS